METQELHHEVTRLAEALTEYKAANDCRLTHIETMTEQEVQLEQKMDGFSARLEEATQRLSKLEAARHRPAREEMTEAREDVYCKGAFQTYLRKGTDHRGAEVKALSSLSDSGGSFVPQYVGDKIIATLNSCGSLRALASAMTISTEAVELLVDKGQADVGWVTEMQDRPETAAPAVSKVRIAVHELYAKPRATQKLLDDARVDVEGWMVQKVADKMAIMENHAFLFGDGKTKPRGILTYPQVPAKQWEWGKIETIEVLKSSFQDEKSVYDDIISLYHALKAEYLPEACWVMSREVLSYLRKLKDKTGRHLWEPALGADVPSTLLGHPIYIIDDMPKIQDNKDTPIIMFGNFKAAYQIVDRAGLQILRDPYSAKPYVEFYVTRRVGGDLVNFEAIKTMTVLKNS